VYEEKMNIKEIGNRGRQKMKTEGWTDKQKVFKTKNKYKRGRKWQKETRI